MKNKKLGLVLGLMLIVTAFAHADVTVGGGGGGNCFPWSCYGVGEWQQVYRSSAFSGPITISSLTFFTSQYGTSGITGNYVVSFSTTSAGINALNPNYVGNIGGDNQVFFSGNLSGAYTISGTPFFYNPANGNLLLDVYVNGESFSGYYAAQGYGFPNDSNTSRLWHGNNTYDGALKTQFGTSAAVPEPSSLILLGSGLLGVGGTLRRRFVR